MEDRNSKVGDITGDTNSVLQSLGLLNLGELHTKSFVPSLQTVTIPQLGYRATQSHYDDY
jgi:hypothetical protein